MAAANSSPMAESSRTRWRTGVLARHLQTADEKYADPNAFIELRNCLSYESPEETSGGVKFEPHEMRLLLDGENIQKIDQMFKIFSDNKIFWTNEVPEGGKIFTAMDYNSTKEEQREITFKRILFLRDRGFFKGWLSDNDISVVKEKAAMHEAIGMYDHSMAVKLGVHIHLWGGAIKYLGSQIHHKKYLKASEDYDVAGCFGLTELGHGSNVRGIETIAKYDPTSQEFIILTPCETAQKYWIGGAAMHANHTVAFAQLIINGRNEGVHAFIVPIRDKSGQILPGVRIADCGHKIGLNGIDNGRIWFDNVRVPRENLLSALANVSPDGKYHSSITDPDQRFAASMAPLTGGRVTIAVSAVNQCKIGLAIALRYSLSRRAFSLEPGKPEVLLLDYPSHQRRLLPLLAKTYALNFACNDLKKLYIHRKPEDAKTIHVRSSGYKAIASWHMLKTLQECREACGGMGISSTNRIGQLKSEHDVMATFEGDNNVLMQTVSKALLGDYMIAKKKGKLIYKNYVPVPEDLDASVLLNEDFQINLFKLREFDLLERFSSQISHLISSGHSMMDAFNESYQLATDLGRAHAESEILESSIHVLQSQSEGALKDALRMMISLFVLTTMDEDPVFLRYGYITARNSRLVHSRVSELCKQLRPYTLSLVCAFGLPDHMLGPIAFNWVDFNSYSAGTMHSFRPQENLDRWRTQKHAHL